MYGTVGCLVLQDGLNVSIAQAQCTSHTALGEGVIVLSQYKSNLAVACVFVFVCVSYLL